MTLARWGRCEASVRLLLLLVLLGLAAHGDEPERVDVNLATERQLAQVPGLGPARARAIVKDRMSNGPYRRIAQLERVSGISYETVRKLEPYLAVGDYKAAREAVRIERENAPPYAGPIVDINTADAAGIQQLPGIGATKAQRIFEDRERRGPFRSCRGLERVDGIGPATVDQLLEACVASRPERGR
jgi:competence protein ComEA